MQLKRGWLHVISALFLGMLTAQAWASQVNCPQKLDLTDKLHVWIDKAAATSYPQVLQESFKPVKQDYSFGLTDAAIWVKLNVRLPENCTDAKNWLLRINVPYHDEIDVYQRQKNGKVLHWQGGDQGMTHSGELATRLPTIPISLSQQDTMLFVRFFSQNTLSVSMDVISGEAYQHHEQKMLMASSFIGALILLSLLLALLNLAFFKAKSFFYYAGFTTAISFLMMFVHGWTNVLWPAHYGDAIATLSQPFAAIFLVLFSNELMKLRLHYKKLFYVQFIVALSISLWAVISVWMVEYRWSLPFSHLGIGFILISLFAVALRLWLWKNELVAKAYALVFSFIIIAMLLRLGAVKGILPINFWTENSMSLALSAQVILFLFLMFIQYYQEREKRLALEQKSKQTAEEVNKRRTFMNLLSHELMTPLSILDSSVRNIQEDWTMLSQAQQQQLEKQRNAVKRMRQMVEMCLARNYWEPAQHLGNFAVNTFAHKAQQELEALLDSQRLNWTGQVDQRCRQAKIAGQLEPLVMVLSLIVHNALKYSKEVCDIELCCKKGMLEVSVRDRGIGFDAKVLNPKPFERGDNVSNTQGLGLGLTVAHELLQGYGGQLTIQTLSPGSLVTFCVPLQKQ
ncbi:MAG: sensor histidine kinase [Gammaproteobacteria bacterium]|nr:sensor histidine kinase [Gammaproteobacteria bacterium]